MLVVQERLGGALYPGRPRVLVVEDNLFIAMEMESLVEQCGCAVIGPAASVSDALHAAADSDLDGAVLDINLGDERVWPVADLLEQRSVPFIFATGYSNTEVPEQFRHHPLLTKPLSSDRLGKALREIGVIASSQ